MTTSNFFSISRRGKDFKSSIATGFLLGSTDWPVGPVVGILSILAMLHVCELQQRLPENLQMPRNIDAASGGVVKRNRLDLAQIGKTGRVLIRCHA